MERKEIKLLESTLYCSKLPSGVQIVEIVHDTKVLNDIYKQSSVKK